MTISSNKLFLIKVIMVMSFLIFLFVFFNFHVFGEEDIKTSPVSGIYEFEKRYIQNQHTNSLNENYMLMDTVAFSLSDQNSTQVFSGTNYDEGVVFSFQEMNNPINYVMTTRNEDGSTELYSGSFTNDCAIRVELKPHTTYELEYGIDPIEPKGKNMEVIGPLHGKFNIYKVVK